VSGAELDAAQALRDAGDLRAGWAALHRAVAAGWPGARALAGRWLVEEGRLAQALPLLNQALRADPRDAEARAALAEARLRAGQAAEALALADGGGPTEDLRLLVVRAEALGLLGRWREVPGAWAQVVQRAGGHPGVAERAARGLLRADRPEAAVAALDGVPDEGPRGADRRVLRAIAVHQRGRGAECALQLGPLDALGDLSLEGRLLLGELLGALGRTAEAEATLEPLLADPAGEDRARAALGAVRLRAGDADGAGLLLDPLVAGGRAPPSALVAWARAQRDGPRRAEAAAQLEAALPGFHPQARAVALHALGELRAAAGDRGGAVEAWRAAHALGPPKPPPGQFPAACAELAERLSADALRAPEAADDRGAPGDGVVFIVGMPRSGTTLVEQILSCHPEVCARGELTALGPSLGAPEAAAALGWADALRREGPAARAARGRAYLAAAEALGPARPEHRVFTDKLPTNSFYLGGAALTLPRARAVWVQRDPLDTCLSAWSQPFSPTLAALGDLEGLGRFWRAQHELMLHWCAAMPVPPLIVRYEQLVDDLEGQVRRLLGALGLPFHAGCLRFWEAARPVATASYDQVRRPLYRGSIGRSRTWLPWLAPLRAGLGPWDPVDEGYP